MRRQASFLCLAIAIGAGQTPVQASDPLGFYVVPLLGRLHCEPTM